MRRQTALHALHGLQLWSVTRRLLEDLKLIRVMNRMHIRSAL